MVGKFIAKYYVSIIIIGVLLIFLRDIIKILIKGTSNMDIIDILINIVIFIVFSAVVLIIRKTNKA